ncbi:hypothetical protein [Nitrosomonas sp.]|uniref:hypothetical protein n=1 Tax=Nitrosomonas sp. TaxID=42353 RepID=UPI00284FAACA|nr:hypothetical protein [Nitrosomonas sp.]MDR4513708.1 hypothetical protein [Nitrosomonas sp.]
MNDEVELLYKEKVRLNDVVNGYAESIFKDIKMLGALGSALVVWEPVLNGITGQSVSIEGLFFGFLGINIAITLIGLLNLSKQSAMNFYLDEVRILEKEIRNKLNFTDIDDRKSFQGVDNWKSKGKQIQKKVASPFFFLITVVEIVLPTIILYHYSKATGSYEYIWFYLVPAILLSALYYSTSNIVHGKKSQQ